MRRTNRQGFGSGALGNASDTWREMVSCARLFALPLASIGRWNTFGMFVWGFVYANCFSNGSSARFWRFWRMAVTLDVKMARCALLVASPFASTASATAVGAGPCELKSPAGLTDQFIIYFVRRGVTESWFAGSSLPFLTICASSGSGTDCKTPSQRCQMALRCV